MDKATCGAFLDILKAELKKAQGCTEPIAIALAAAKASEILGMQPETLEIRCSANMFKNAKCVTVPNSNGMKGIGAAAALGALGGRPEKELEVLSQVTEEHCRQAETFLREGRFSYQILDGVDNLYVSVTAKGNGHSATVTISHTHTSIVRIEKDGTVIFQSNGSEAGAGETDLEQEKEKLTVKAILEFAEQVPLEEIESVISQQVEFNLAISRAGMAESFGAEVGKALLAEEPDSVRARAKARAAAGSDARMSGCLLPVVINSGSGNQGLTVTMPVLTYGEHLGVSREKLYRALVISNLISIHEKRYLGQLSAFCGAVTAAAGAGAAITYLYGGSYEQICGTIVNTLASAGGMVCDGAKPSCAAKISCAVDAAITGMEMSLKNRAFLPGEGIVQEEIERTIKAAGYLGRVGMQQTDREILQLMSNAVGL